MLHGARAVTLAPVRETEAPILPPDDAHPFDRLIHLVALLRGPEGCPWDRAQSLESLKPHLIEEAYEAAEAVETGEDPALAEELGDLLFLVLFMGRLLGERTPVTAADLAAGITAKMIARHPHVFQDAQASTPGEVIAHWEKIKSRERRETAADSLSQGKSSVLDGLPRTLPALQRAHRLQERAGGLGFDWPGPAPVMEKLREELAELEAELTPPGAAPDRERVMAEIGDVLFSVVNLARHLELNAEEALRLSSEKFRRRFRAVESGIAAAGRPLGLEEMDRLWDEAKKSEAG